MILSQTKTDEHVFLKSSKVQQLCIIDYKPTNRFLLYLIYAKIWKILPPPNYLSFMFCLSSHTYFQILTIYLFLDILMNKTSK